MPFLSLGLLKDEQSQESFVARASADAESSKEGKLTKPPLAGFDVAEESSKLPPAIEELRSKISVNQLPQVTVWGVKKKGDSPTHYLTIADRQGVPTFGTFKFGYVPGRGLLYSVITHEV